MSVRNVFTVIAATCILLTVASARAGTSYFTVSSGDYATASNWSSGIPGPGFSGVIGGSASGLSSVATLSSAVGNEPDELRIGSDSYSGALNLNGSASLWAVNLNVGYNSGAGTLSIAAGELDTEGDISIGNSGTGNVIQTGGALKEIDETKKAVIGFAGAGAYNMSGGSFIVSGSGGLHVGYSAAGTLTQSGSALVNVAYGNCVLGDQSNGSGIYTLKDTGSLTVYDNLVIGNLGAGTLTQSGGAVAATNCYIGYQSGSSGNYTLSGGSLSLTSTNYNLYVGYGGAGTFTLSGGTASVYNCFVAVSAGAGTLTISNGTLNIIDDFDVGWNGAKGVVKQTGGTVTETGTGSTGWFTEGIGGGNGAYNLQGGVFAFSAPNGGDFRVGYGGTGTFTQSGGSLTVSNNNVYVGLGGVGTFTLSGGTASAFSNFYVGFSGGIGTLNISNTGTLNVAGALAAGDGSGAAYVYQTGGAANFSGDLSGSGTYNLSGGTLNMNAHNVSVASLNFSGGTLTNAGTISSNMTLGSTSTGAVFQQSSGSATVVSGTISGVGGLTKTGLGTLDFSNATLNYAGTTTIAAGTLRTSITSLISLLGGSATTAVNVQSNTSKLLIDYTGFESYKSLYDEAMQSILQTSYNSAGGHFASGMIYSPTATAAGNALGWNDNGSNQITVAYTLYGDANLDGVVNGADLGAVLANFGSTSGTWYMGDFNYDGSVNGADLGVVLANFSQHISATAAVPEPSSLLLAAAGLVGLLALALKKRG